MAPCSCPPGDATSPFQSPSRGGHLRGPLPQAGPASYHTFQSPSRGGHLRGLVAPTWTPAPGKVSVPFARGTPPWARGKGRSAKASLSFSPLREGDTSVGPVPVLVGRSIIDSFSPLREGDTSVVARPPAQGVIIDIQSFSPLREGDTSVGPGQRKGQGHNRSRFSPLREGDTSVAHLTSSRPDVSTSGFSPLREGDTSVGTRRAPGEVDGLQFQSPSRGGHLRGPTLGQRLAQSLTSFSPLREGDTSVGSLDAAGWRRQLRGFSPLREGDTSVGPTREPSSET